VGHGWNRVRDGSTKGGGGDLGGWITSPGNGL
jgi:hypothetical protein